MAKGLHRTPPQHSHGCGSTHVRPGTGRSSPCNQYWLLYKVKALKRWGSLAGFSRAPPGGILRGPGPPLRANSGTMGLESREVKIFQRTQNQKTPFTQHNPRACKGQGVPGLAFQGPPSLFKFWPGQAMLEFPSKTVHILG